MPDKVFSSEWAGVDSKHPVYIGIDQSYSGFAITMLRDNGSFRTTVRKMEGKGVDRLADVFRHIQSELYQYQDIADVAIEGYAYGSHMANMLGELGGVVKVCLRFQGHYPLIVPPTNLKKYATGKGTGVSKSQIMLSVYKKWGVEFTDDNAADSYVLARIAQGKPTLAYEKEVYDKLQDPKYRER